MCADHTDKVDQAAAGIDFGDGDAVVLVPDRAVVDVKVVLRAQ